MKEKNGAIVTEKELFAYIRDHPGITKAELIAGLRTNSLQIAHKLKKFAMCGFITESDDKYQAAAEFSNVTPKLKTRSVRHPSKYLPVIAAYKHVLAGEDLDKIDAPDDVKNTIRLFEKYRSLSACQIREKTGLSTWLTVELRALRKAQRKATLAQIHG